MIIVHSLKSGKVAATPILKPVPSQFSPLFSKLKSCCTLTRQLSPTKIETKRKLQQFTVSGWLTINGGESGNEKNTLYNVCSVHRGVFSTSGGFHEYIGGCSVHRRDSMSTSEGFHEYIGGIS